MAEYRTKTDWAFEIFNYILMAAIVFFTLFPFWNAFVGSFNKGIDFARGGVYFWPREFTLSNYIAVFQNSRILSAYRVTVLRTVIGTILSVLVCALFAYAFSRKDLVGKNLYGVMGLGIMFFYSGLIPTYMIIKRLGLINNFLVYLFPHMFNFFYVLMMQAYFKENIPTSLIESAKMNGAGEYRIFFSLVLPLSKPIIAVMLLFQGVWHWNYYKDALIYTTKPELETLQLLLMKVIRTAQQSSVMAQAAATAGTTSTSVQMATMMVATLPILALYPFLQRYFVKGIMVGAVKG